MPGAVPALAGDLQPRLAGLLWFVAVACETLFVVVTVAQWPRPWAALGCLAIWAQC